MDKIFTGTVKDRQVVLDDREQFRLLVQGLEGKDIELVMRKKKRRRSLAENAYYWAVPIAILSDLWGYTPDETHEICLAKWSKVPSEKRGVPDKILRSSEMTTVEFEGYMERIRRGAAVEFACYIPEPNEVEYGG